MLIPWNNWYHINGNTYGTWLPGDPRGYRTVRHKNHIAGDYKHPPKKDQHLATLIRSKQQLKRPPIYLTLKAAQQACTAFHESLERDKIEHLAIAVDDHHYHVLARFPDRRPRHWIGLAKRRSALQLTQQGLAEKGGIWATKCRCLPITDRQHQLNCYHYILNHQNQRAAIWNFKDQPPLHTHSNPPNP